MTELRDSYSDKDKHIISRIESTLSSIDDNHTVLERKAQHNFVTISAASSIIIAIAVTSGVLGSLSEFSQVLIDRQRDALIAFGACHLIVTLAFLFVHAPRERPVKLLDLTSDQVEKWLDMDSTVYLHKAMSTYLQLCIDDDKPVQKKGCAVQISTLGTGIGVFCAWLYFLLRFLVTG